MSGIIFFYVGVVLFTNGLAQVCKFEARSIAVINLFVGGLTVFCNGIILFHSNAGTPIDVFLGVATGFLFGFTYLYVAINSWYDLDGRPLGWFCFFVAINTIWIGAYLLDKGPDNVYIIAEAIFWWLWGILWLMFWAQLVLNKLSSKLIGYVCILEGIVTCWIPGVLMLTGNWHS